jgi:hypothetical protein
MSPRQDRFWGPQPRIQCVEGDISPRVNQLEREGQDKNAGCFYSTSKYVFNTRWLGMELSSIYLHTLHSPGLLSPIYVSIYGMVLN